MKFVIAVLCLGLSIKLGYSQESENESAFGRIEIEVGKTISLPIDSALSLEVGRRGIIDLSKGEGGRWLVTGLRRGLVTLSWQCSEEKECKRIIEVSASEKEDPDENPVLYLSSSIIHVSVKIVLCKAAQLRSNGLDLMAEGFLKNNFLGSLKTYAKFQQSNIRHKIVAEPQGIVLLGESLSLHSGGEILYISGEGKKKNGFKPYGVMIEIKPLHFDSRKSLHIAQVNLALSSDSAGEGKIGMHKLKSVVRTLDRNESLLGQSELNNEKSSESNTPFLNSVPIIGPLFRLNEVSDDLDTVLFWVKLERVE